MKIRSLKIGELSDYILRSVNYDPILQNIYVEGELSNLKIHSTGNVYFTLKDDNNKIRCIMFSDYMNDLIIKKDINDGDQILCRGNINYYKREGYISFIVQEIKKIGESEAYQEFLQLKEELSSKGYFDPAIKKELPKFPRKIGVVTSPTGAVIQDIYHVIKRRYPAIDIIVFPAHVQGESASQEVSEGIRYLDQLGVDTIIVARGGGSYEELAAFNTKEVANAIFDSSTPIISAVGHETDFTISDFVADVRASTPSVAAEIAVPNLSDIKMILNEQKYFIQTIINKLFISKQDKIEYSKKFLQSHTPKMLLGQKQNYLSIQKNRLNLCVLKVVDQKKKELEDRSRRIFSKNPENIYDFGGAFLYNISGDKVDTINHVAEGMDLKVVLKDGKFTVKVVEIQ